MLVLSLIRQKTLQSTNNKNGQCERFDSTLISILGILPEQGKSYWKGHIAVIVHAYMCTRSTTTGYSPYFLIFGSHLRLALDVSFRVKFADMELVSTRKYMDKLRNCFQWAYKVVHKTISHKKLIGKKKI